MKRIAMFLAVFSVGLVLFMALTGQLSKMFRKPVDPFAADYGEIDPNAENTFRYTSPDREHRRDRFKIEGLLDSKAPLKLEQSEQIQAVELSHATVTIPIYDDASAKGGFATETDRFFELDAGRATYRSKGEGTFTLSDGIVGSESSENYFRTQELVALLGSGNDKATQLHGNSPIVLRYFAIELFGSSGFDGTIHEGAGLDEISIRPPVVVSIAESQTGGFLGLPAAEPVGKDKGAESDRIFLVTDHTLVLRRGEDKGTAAATIDGGATIFRADARTPLHPRPKAPFEQFRCEWLQLVVGAESIQHARALGVKEPVLANFLVPGAGGKMFEYQAKCEVLDWLGAEQGATLSGKDGVRTTGPLGSFRSDTATLDPVDQECTLLGSIDATIRDPRSGDPASATPRSWRLHADRVGLALFEDRGSEELTERVREFWAESDRDGGLELDELIAAADGSNEMSGARLTGRRVEYDSDAQALIITGSEVERPCFVDGLNHIEARTITLSLKKRRVMFDGGVVAVVPDLVQMQRSRRDLIADEIPAGEATLKGDHLVLGWDEGHHLATLAVSEQPGRAVDLRFKDELHGTFELHGDAMTWSRESHSFEVSGSSRQSLRFIERSATITAARFTLDLAAWIATASGDVNGRFAREILIRSTNAKQTPSTAKNEVELNAAQVIVEFVAREQEASHSDSDENNATKAQGESDKSARHDTPDIRRVTARGNIDDATGEVASVVDVSDGIFEAQGSKITWLPAQHRSDPNVPPSPPSRLRLHGPGREELRYRAEDGSLSEAAADEIEIVESEHGANAAMSGAVVCDVPHRLIAEARDAAERARVYTVNADHIDLQFERMPTSSKHHSRATNGSSSGKRKAQETQERQSDHIEPTGLYARGELRVDSADGEVTFTGQECRWRSLDQRIVLFAADGSGLQSVRVGQPHERSEIVARQISIVRDPAEQTRTWVLLEHVLDSTLIVPPHERSGDVPESIHFQGDNALVELRQVRKAKDSGTRTRGAKGAAATSVNRATADDETTSRFGSELTQAICWGHVQFKGGDRQILSHRAIYQRQRRSITFEGRQGEPPRIVQGTEPTQLGGPLVLTKRPRQGFQFELDGVNRATASGLDSILGDLFGKTERRDP